MCSASAPDVRLNKGATPTQIAQPSQKYSNGPNVVAAARRFAGAFSPGKRRIDHELPTRLNR